MDTKGTKELIRALNPESELRAVAKQEEEFIERAQLRRDSKRNSVFRRGINYMTKKLRGNKSKRRMSRGFRQIRKGSVLDTSTK
jgi:hypothetical protein